VCLINQQLDKTGPTPPLANTADPGGFSKVRVLPGDVCVLHLCRLYGIVCIVIHKVLHLMQVLYT